MINAAILYTLAIILTGVSFMKDRNKTKSSNEVVENVSQSSTCDALHHAFRWLIAFYINAVLYLFYYWGAIRVYRHCVFSNTRLRCTYSKLCRVPSWSYVSPTRCRPTSSCGTYVYTHVSRNYNIANGTKDIRAKLCLSRNAAALLMSLLFSYIIWMVMV